MIVLVYFGNTSLTKSIVILEIMGGVPADVAFVPHNLVSLFVSIMAANPIVFGAKACR